MPPRIDADLCNTCGNCYLVCPQDVFAFEDGEVPTIAYPVECWHCGSCVIDCPTGACYLRLPLQMQIVPSPALYGPTGPGDEEMERRAAAFTRSIIL